MKILKSHEFDMAAFKTTPIQSGNEIEARVDEIIENVRKRNLGKNGEAKWKAK